jgi:transposase-like protein
MPKRYPQEFKDDVVRVARTRDVSLESIAADFGISVTTLKRWMAQADVDDGVTEGVTTTEQAELAEMRRRNRRLEQEVEILRRATAYFAKDAAPK